MRSLHFRAINNELDALKMLQSIEYAAGIRKIEQVNIECSYDGVQALVDEFSFRRIASVFSDPLETPITPEETLFQLVKDNQNYIADFSKLFEHIFSADADCRNFNDQE